MTTNDPIVIVAAKRTPIGNFNGGLSTLPAHDLGAVAIRAVMDEAKVGGADIDEVIMGQVLTAAAGQNPARQAAMAAGIPHEKTALTVNQVCGSGLRTVALGMQSILNGDATVIVAGGQENMSLSPHAMHMRNGTKMGNATMVDTMIVDGLWDAFNGYHMGMTAENIAEKWQITRADQDNFAAASQQKTEAAQKAGKFTAEITPVKIKVKKDEVTIDKDEFPRAGVTAESLSGLRPAFKPDGTVTAASASGINDGAAAVVLMRASEAKKRGLPVYATIRSWATAGVDPAVMGSGPIPASRKALEKAGWSVSDLDLVEANEAFAAQSLCVLKDLALDPAKVNVNGGAIAIGHPIGASGTRVLVTLLHEMARRDAKRGLVTLCIGGGMGIAMCVERDASENLKKVA
ncbi:acetyl-CoA C-acetyltransferase [Micavibrio aeruginosavorus]|uniref:3-ketoacyl-CoA thiolase / Acetyl-CoA acetyltransferase n=1 Tax=Micavibrio aeruginosavorus EPB TaxID=349215 RepID=M4VI71_9BACT|nr:acetyl-CoA C-acetyltransferase [Micavibrio aeruginosavorus]AGH97746.1 3-ketoacyl-CoA thiolase / Acetyl-CoA acetyltransferase [Micavibrio aeruginosavorus EPB]